MDTCQVFVVMQSGNVLHLHQDEDASFVMKSNLSTSIHPDIDVVFQDGGKNTRLGRHETFPNVYGAVLFTTRNNYTIEYCIKVLQGYLLF